MDDLTFKEKYKKYKFRVKLWENDFKKKHGRVPSKYDIQEAPREIRDSYKMYYKLKTSLLEDTLNEALANDGFDILDITQSANSNEFTDIDDEGGSSVNGGPQLPFDISAIVAQADSGVKTAEAFLNLDELPHPSALSSLTHNDRTIDASFDRSSRKFHATEELHSNTTAWGENVSKKLLQTEPEQVKDGRVNKSFNTRLFKSSFSKRNPRKSLLRMKSDVSVSQQQNTLEKNSWKDPELLPDLETILTQKVKEQQLTQALPVSSSILMSSENKTKQGIRMQLDEGWLVRNVNQNDCANIEQNTTDNLRPRLVQTYGLSNINVSKIIPPNTEIATFDSSKREIDINPVLEDNLNNIIIEPINQIAKIKKHKAVKSDSDSVVSGSDDEDKLRIKRTKRRRLLPTVEETGTLSSSKLEEIEPNLSKTLSNSVKVLNGVREASSGAEPAQEDFSPNESDVDPNYTPENNAENRRKKAVPKRTIRSKKTSTASVHIKKVPNVTGPRNRTTRYTKEPQSKTEDENVEEDPYKPPSPENLKSVLTLDGGSITSAPRVTTAELEVVDAVANRYINTTSSISQSHKKLPGNITVIDEKRNAAKRKLEEKIASGRLNENFVRINIEKKRYVRGKKSINFSKYKKQLWKDKKRVAALTGPDMDMRGCDGGVLKCFTCGQAGHFAQNCKMKGDTLLPLSAQIEEDPSPFPTLQEVAHMASKSACAVHSRDIDKLPKATNEKLVYDMLETEQCVGNEIESDNESKNTGNHDNILMDDEDDEKFINIDIDTLEKLQKISPVKKYVGSKIPEDFLKKAGLDLDDNSPQELKKSDKKVSALYELNADNSIKEVTPEVMDVLHMFGHTSFRKGQDRAIMRILSGLSTLVTLSTGSGKSLCYQLPAYMYSRQKGSITLVVSPLVSLMEDQVTGVPHFLRAYCLHTNQTKPQRMKIMQKISEGEVDILLVSPEAIVSGERSMGFGSILRQLPPIAFACIDEAHCVSQWSHNFRPSYLMICKVLKKNLGVKTILGLTATATLPTRLSIIDHLGIADGESGIISDTPLPDNLILSVSKDENRDAALLELLNSERFEKCQSIIVYCTRREECERIAGFLRTCMQDRTQPNSEVSQKKRKRVTWQAEPYHAGMAASRRRTVQNAFMKNELRIVVATIAFGMGINKPDIRAIIHYNMPRCFESYVQEIGRAGRDGKISHCHLFLDALGNDQNELRRHIYSNSIDRHVIRRLLQNIFIPCSCAKNTKNTETNLSNETDNDNIVLQQTLKRSCPGHEIGISKDSTVEALDIPEENISTLLCYMELQTRWNVNVLSSAYMKAKVISYGGAKYLKHAARECPPLAMAIALEIKKNTFNDNSNIIEFPVIDIAAAIGWNSGVVKHQLKNLEWTNVNGIPQRSAISVQFTELGFRLKAPGDFTSEEIDDALDTLYECSVKQEKTQLIQLQYVAQGLSSVAFNSYVFCNKEDLPLERSEQLKAIIRDYFLNDYPKDLKLEYNTNPTLDGHIIDDIHGIINMYPENKFNGRTIARIFHGISSPNYPAVIWGRCKFWRAHFSSDFNRIIQLANSVIVKRRT